MHDEKEYTQAFDWGIWARLKPFLKNYRADCLRGRGDLGLPRGL